MRLRASNNIFSLENFSLWENYPDMVYLPNLHEKYTEKMGL